jgi:hypothetical protein
MGLNPSAAFLLIVSWGVIAVTTVWCFYRMMVEGRRAKNRPPK